MNSFLVCCRLTLCSLLAQGLLHAADVFEHNKKLGRGVNIIGYDPIWKSRDQARFQQKHFRLLKEAGFDSIRVNLHAFRHMDAAPAFTLRDSWLSTLDWIVEQALQQRLMVILDLHEFGSMGDNPEANHDRFLSFWRQVSEHCKNAPESVVFEILNEPAKKLTPQLWNQYLREALAIIRRDHPTRTVIVGPAFWNGIGHLGELELPREDNHIVVTVHYYSPMEFTHQGAAWSEHKDKSGIEWRGSDAERRAILNDFRKAADWAKANNRPVFLGEFGAYDRAPLESRVRYTDAVARTAESLGWSWAYWQFDSDFVLWDMKQDAWVEPILKALTPRR